MDQFNIEDVEEGDKVQFISPLNHATSPVKAVDKHRRMVLINYFENPDLAIDRVNKWVSFDDLHIVQKG